MATCGIQNTTSDFTWYFSINWFEVLYLPEHWGPSNPAAHRHVSGREHVPPFGQDVESKHNAV